MSKNFKLFDVCLTSLNLKKNIDVNFYIFQIEKLVK